MISEKMKISVGLAITVIGGGTGWLTSLAIQTSDNTKMLASLDAKQIKYNETVQTIEKDLAIVKTRIELLLELQQNSKRREPHG